MTVLDNSTYPRVSDGLAYAVAVTEGKMNVCKWMRLACERALNDLQRVTEPDYPYYFDFAEAERVTTVIELMPHTKGDWMLQRMRLTLAPWQRFITGQVFGWRRKEPDHLGRNLRRFRTAFIMVPRKNGKSAWSAAVGHYMLSFDGEAGAEVYCGASSMKQADEIFIPAREMVKRYRRLQSKGVQFNSVNIHNTRTASKFERLIFAAPDGQSPHCYIGDELHEHRDSRQVDTMDTGMGSRAQPLKWLISTAGDSIHGVCHHMQKTCESILLGLFPDETTFSAIYTIDDGEDDPLEIASFHKANPNANVSMQPGYLEEKLARAKTVPRDRPSIFTKHLNMWVQSRTAYFDPIQWAGCHQQSVQDMHCEDRGRTAYGALDLASKIDLCAFAIAVPHNETVRVHTRFWLPEAQLAKPENAHYLEWLDGGHLRVTEGELIDFDRIRDEVLEDCRHFDMQSISYDPHQATMLVGQLMKQRVNMVEVRQSVANLSEPMKQVDAWIKGHKLAHGGNRVMDWCMANVSAREDAKGHVYPRKPDGEQSKKIDGAVALIMAAERVMNLELLLEPPQHFVREGVVVL